MLWIPKCNIIKVKKNNKPELSIVRFWLFLSLEVANKKANNIIIQICCMNSKKKKKSVSAEVYIIINLALHLSNSSIKSNLKNIDASKRHQIVITCYIGMHFPQVLWNIHLTISISTINSSIIINNYITINDSMNKFMTHFTKMTKKIKTGQILHRGIELERVFLSGNENAVNVNTPSSLISLALGGGGHMTRVWHPRALHPSPPQCFTGNQTVSHSILSPLTAKGDEGSLFVCPL